jgi:Flp pilus assembly protein TadG
MRGRVKCRCGRLRTHRSGQAVVEFALIAPILLLIIFGLVDFARGWSAHHTIADAAREGARITVVDNGATWDSALVVMNNRMAAAGLDPGRATITPEIGADRGDPTTVTIEYTFDYWLLDIFINWVNGEETVSLVSQITMRNE